MKFKLDVYCLRTENVVQFQLKEHQVRRDLFEIESRIIKKLHFQPCLLESKVLCIRVLVRVLKTRTRVRLTDTNRHEYYTTDFYRPNDIL